MRRLMKPAAWFVLLTAAAIVFAVFARADFPSPIRTQKPADPQATASVSAPLSAAAPASAPATAAGSPERRPGASDAGSIKIPQAYEIKLVGIPEPHGGPGWMGSLVIGALAAALASVATTYIAAEKKAALENELQLEKHRHERQMEGLARDFETERSLMDQQHQDATQEKTLSREDQKIATERDRLRMNTDLSAVEVEMAASRLVREQEAEFARLIHLFFEKLTSDNPIHRDVALFAISEFDRTDSLKKVLEKKRAAVANLAQTPQPASSPVM